MKKRGEQRRGGGRGGAGGAAEERRGRGGEGRGDKRRERWPVKRLVRTGFDMVAIPNMISCRDPI